MPRKCKRINKTVDSEHANRNEHVNTNETLPSATEDNINDSDIFSPTRANTTTHGTAQPSSGWLDQGNMLDNSGVRTNLIPSFSNIQYGGMTQQGSLQQSLASGSVRNLDVWYRPNRAVFNRVWLRAQLCKMECYKWEVWLMPNLEAIN